MEFLNSECLIITFIGNLSKIAFLKKNCFKISKLKKKKSFFIVYYFSKVSFVFIGNLNFAAANAFAANAKFEVFTSQRTIPGCILQIQ